jgi:pantetheine-phosphate adenylyltransferase
MRRVLVPGTFDPITLGHLDVVRRSSQMFDEVIIGVAASQNKGGGTLFTLEERVELAKEVTVEFDNVQVRSFDNLLVDFAMSLDVTAIVKGLRATTDFEYEFQMAMLNYKLEPTLETLFVMSSPEYMYVSSSIAKEIASLGGVTKSLVPPLIEKALKDKLA